MRISVFSPFFCCNLLISSLLFKWSFKRHAQKFFFCLKHLLNTFRKNPLDKYWFENISGLYGQNQFLSSKCSIESRVFYGAMRFESSVDEKQRNQTTSRNHVMSIQPSTPKKSINVNIINKKKSNFFLKKTKLNTL